MQLGPLAHEAFNPRWQAAVDTSPVSIATRAWYSPYRTWKCGADGFTNMRTTMP